MHGSAKRLSAALADMPHSRHASDHPDRAKHCDTRDLKEAKALLEELADNILLDPHSTYSGCTSRACGSRCVGSTNGPSRRCSAYDHRGSFFGRETFCAPLGGITSAVELRIFEACDTGTMALSSSARSATPERRSQARAKHALERQEKFDRQTTG